MLHPSTPYVGTRSAIANDFSGNRPRRAYMVGVVADPAPSRLVFAHAAIFTAGVLTFFLSVIGSTPYLLLVSGPCFVVSGILVGLGTRITLAGPLGGLLRAALGGPRVTMLWIRALVWIGAGLLVTLYGIERLVHENQKGHEPPAEITYVHAR